MTDVSAYTPSKVWVETPLVESRALSKAAGCRILLKLEYLQPSGSFKSRGIGAFMLARLEEHQAARRSGTPHFYIASGGNAGLAAVHAAQSLGLQCTVAVPMSCKEMMVHKLRVAGAHDVIKYGSSWAEANANLIENALKHDENGVYVPPFDHKDVWRGNSTLVDELRGQYMNFRPKKDKPAAVVCSCGGGGLFVGIAQALDSHDYNEDWSKVNIIACETTGAESLNASLKAGELVTLDAITSQATSLGAKRVAAKAFEYAQRDVVKSVVLSDAEAARGCVMLADEERVLVELACGVNITACMGGRLEKALGRRVDQDECVIIVVCGGSLITPEILSEYRQLYGTETAKVDNA